jgi:hypothetical protein
MKRAVCRLLFVSFTVALVALTGCGGSDSKLPPLIPVAGKVTIGGTPLAQGTVTFLPDESKGNTSKFSPTGMIQSDGTYKLMTSNTAGAPAGWYKVGVSASGMSGMGGEPPTVPDPNKKTDPMKALAKEGAQIPQRFQNPATSGISIEVKDGAGADAYNITLTK